MRADLNSRQARENEVLHVVANLVRFKVTQGLSDQWVAAEGWADEAARTGSTKKGNLQDMRIGEWLGHHEHRGCHGHFPSFAHRGGRAGDVLCSAEIDVSGGVSPHTVTKWLGQSALAVSRRRSETGPIFAGPVGELRTLTKLSGLKRFAPIAVQCQGAKAQ